MAFDLGQFGSKLYRLRSEQQLELAELSAGSGISSDRLAALEGERLITYAAELLAANVPVVLAGDYNVVPTLQDIYPMGRRNRLGSWREGQLPAPKRPRVLFGYATRESAATH